MLPGTPAPPPPLKHPNAPGSVNRGADLEEMEMTGMIQTRSEARLAPIMALALSLPLMLLPAAPAQAAGKSVIWMRVEVNDQGGEHTKVKVNLPLSLIEVVVDSIDKRDFMAELEQDHPSLDIPKLWKEIRKMEGSEFVTIESDKANVRVWKDNEFFRINVTEEGQTEPNVEVKLPLAVMDYLFDTGGKELSFENLVEKLRGHLPLTVVQVQHEDEHVKIWLEEEE